VSRAEDLPPRAVVCEEAREVHPPTRERIRLALIELTRRGEKINAAVLRAEAGVKMDGAALMLRLYNAKLLPPIFQPWDVEAEAVTKDRVSVEALIREAVSFESLGKLSGEVAARVAAGMISPAQGRTIHGLITERRRNLLDAQDAPKATTTGEILATPDAAELVALYESLINGKRRQAVVAFVRQQALEDALDFPSDAAPEEIRAKLEELGLNAFGDPA
jgi:hypothetical protein